MDGGHVMDDEIPATPSVDEAIRALREYAQFEPQTRVMVWTPALATLVADALEAAARPAAGSSSPDVTALADELRDWPYGRPAFVRSEAEQAADALEAQATRITELEREEMDQELDFQIPEIVKIPFYTVRNGMVLKVLTFQVLGPVADVIEDTGKLVKALEETES